MINGLKTGGTVKGATRAASGGLSVDECLMRNLPAEPYDRGEPPFTGSRTGYSQVTNMKGALGAV